MREGPAMHGIRQEGESPRYFPTLYGDFEAYAPLCHAWNEAYRESGRAHRALWDASERYMDFCRQQDTEWAKHFGIGKIHAQLCPEGIEGAWAEEGWTTEELSDFNMLVLRHQPPSDVT